MPFKLRVATLLAAIVLLAGAVFLVVEFRREPPVDGGNPAAPAGEHAQGVSAKSGSGPGKTEANARVADPAVSNLGSPVAPGTPDPRLAAAIPPNPAAPGAPANGPVPAVVNPPATGGTMPPAPTNPTAGRDMREAAAIDLDKVTLMLRDFRTSMGENPTGTNAEIMTAVMGGNPKGARLGPPENQTLNGNGELVDRWGTPIFFHQLSKTSMEIRSAGPDRMMFTDDDIIAH